MKRLLFIFLIVLSPFFLLAQTGIKGNVKDHEGKALPNVEIAVEPGFRGTVSDENGNFHLYRLDPGKYTLIFSHMGYEDEIRMIEIQKNNILNIQIEMKIEATLLNPIVVKAPHIIPAPFISQEIDRKTMEQVAARDIGDFLRSIPNVSGIRKGGVSIDPVVRGFKFSQLNIQVNNGLKIEGGCPNRMDPTAAHVELEDIDHIEVIKGPFALRYGPSLGGVVNIVTRRPEARESFGIDVRALKGWESNWNGDKEYISVDGGNDKIFFGLSGSQKRYGSYVDGNGNKVNSAFHKFNYKGQVGILLAKKHDILFSYEEAKGRNVLFAALPMDERIDDTRMISLDYRARNISKLIPMINLKVYHSDVAHTMDNKNRSFSDTVAAVSAIEAVNMGVRAEAGLSLGKKGLFIIGLDMENISKDGDRTKNMIRQPNLPKKIEALWNEAKINNLGVFADYRLSKGAMSYNAALRVDFNSASSEDIIVKHPMLGEIYNYGADTSSSSFTNLSFALGATYQLSKISSLSLGLGRGVRSPDMLERFIILLPVGYDKYDYLGDPQLKPETNYEADLTYKLSSPKYGSIEANAFFSYVQDYISGDIIPLSEQKPLTNTVKGVKQFYNTEGATFWGGELSYQTPAKFDWTVKLAAAYTQGTFNEITRHIFNDNGDIVDTEALSNSPVNEIPPFKANLELNYKLISGKLVPRFNIQFSAAQNRVSDAFYEEETPAFTVIDFGLSYHYNRYLTFAGGINNMLDQAYYEHLNRRIIGSTSRIYEPGRIFFMNIIFNI